MPKEDEVEGHKLKEVKQIQLTTKKSMMRDTSHMKPTAQVHKNNQSFQSKLFNSQRSRRLQNNRDLKDRAKQETQFWEILPYGCQIPSYASQRKIVKREADLNSTEKSTEVEDKSNQQSHSDNGVRSRP
ncbi:hypothetical protein B9Z55_000944 [Caenorhabditis nigoni]|uniref:Uncharacterized protein n=1 Tax=Caenorhabditis nigoni TaxID=1611254 RepID=A0A2G5VVN1_9PELO|nr:hypothetical protein B9Z55_000944 [Caenorhabditis nigoni]